MYRYGYGEFGSGLSGSGYYQRAISWKNGDTATKITSRSFPNDESATIDAVDIARISGWRPRKWYEFWRRHENSPTTTEICLALAAIVNRRINDVLYDADERANMLDEANRTTGRLRSRPKAFHFLQDPEPEVTDDLKVEAHVTPSRDQRVYDVKSLICRYLETAGDFDSSLAADKIVDYFATQTTSQEDLPASAELEVKDIANHVG